MTPNGLILIKTLEMTYDSILFKFMGPFEIHSLENTYNSPNKILGEMSLVTGRLNLLFVFKKNPTNNRGGALPLPPLNYPPPAMRNDPSSFIIGGMTQG